MGPQNLKHITFNYFKTVPSCFNKGDVYGEREKEFTTYMQLLCGVHWKLEIL
jgi:hypothetical protein